MPSINLYRMSTRLASAPVRTQLLRPAALSARQPTLRRTLIEPGGNPKSGSQQDADVKSSRATDDPSTTEHGGSIAKPVSGKGDQVGSSEEGDAPMKKGDPSEPAEKKAARIDEAGQKPLDPADK